MHRCCAFHLELRDVMRLPCFLNLRSGEVRSQPLKRSLRSYLALPTAGVPRNSSSYALHASRSAAKLKPPPPLPHSFPNDARRHTLTPALRRVLTRHFSWAKLFNGKAYERQDEPSDGQDDAARAAILEKVMKGRQPTDLMLRCESAPPFVTFLRKY